MRINNNLMAMNTHRQLGIVTDSGAKATEKLSSGYRINRAGDDAAGLAISEKMRGQIRGLNMASKNSQDGISLIQTAEGALQETHAILQRMRELAVQSASDTNVEVDRDEIQKEINQLAEEITRISDTTEFNTQNLLGGRFEAKFHVGANEGQNVDLKINDMSAKALGVAGSTTTIVEVKESEGQLLIDGKVIAAKVGDDGYYLLEDIILKDGEATFKEGAEEVTVKTGKAVEGVIVEEGQILIEGDEGSVVAGVLKDGNTVVGVEVGGKYYALEDVEVKEETGGSGEYKLVLKDGIDSNDDITVADDAKYIEQAGGGINVSSQAMADSAITTINDAIETVSAERSMLGAMQNRLEHTIKNLDTSAENLQASESRIRDVDMAQEMMEFTKQNILQQASTAMLAQANAAPQSVLQLLQ